MHDGKPRSPIQGQGHVPLNIRNSSIFKIHILRYFQWELGNDYRIKIMSFLVYIDQSQNCISLHLCA